VISLQSLVPLCCLLSVAVDGIPGVAHRCSDAGDMGVAGIDVFWYNSKYTASAFRCIVPTCQRMRCGWKTIIGLLQE
jgi:hypothetical protein